MLKASLCIAKKDFTLIFFRGTGIIQALLLGLLLIFIFSLSKGLAEVVQAQGAATCFWLASSFCQILIFNSLYALEEQGQKQALLLAPILPQSIWLAKALVGFIALSLLQLPFILATIIFLEQGLQSNLFSFGLYVLLTNFGLSAIGSLLGALAQSASTKESLLAVLIFPLMLPLILAAIQLSAQFFYSDTLNLLPDNNLNWLCIILAFDAIFIAAGILLFNFIYSPDD